MTRCRTCNHPERDAVEQSVALGWPISAVAYRFGLSASGVRRHLRNHPRHAVEQARRAAGIRRDRRELEHYRALRTVFEENAGVDPDGVPDLVDRVAHALAEEQDFEAEAVWLRAFGIRESAIWRLLEEDATDRGQDAGEVFSTVYGGEG